MLITWIAIIAIAITYLVILYLIRKRFVDKTIIKRMQKKVKEVEELQKKVSNEPRLEDELAKKQIEVAKEMNAFSIAQIKFMVATTIIFFIFIYSIPLIDLTKQDDIHINMHGINTSEISLKIPKDARCGLWYADIKGNEKLSIPFFVCAKEEGQLWLQKPNSINVTYQKIVQPGEQITINFSKSINIKEVVLNNGTRMYLDLPFKIPFLNIQRIYDVKGIFIFFIFILGFIVNPIIDKIMG